MARTDRFREQHNELILMATELQGLLNASALANDATRARSCLGKLLGKLMLHLSAEDQVLYPELVAHKDATIAAMARRFATEMQSTAPQVKAYGERWPTPTAIKQNPSAFIKETKQILSVLADRVERENRELYAAADKIEGKAF